MNLRNGIGWALYHLCAPFVRMPDMLSLYFHNPSPQSFARVLRWVKRKGYRFIGIPELLAYMRGERPVEGRVAIVTFDDAWRGNLALLPVIEQEQVPVTIFAPVEPLQSGNYWWEYAQKKGGRALSDAMKTWPYAQFEAEIARLRTEIPLERSAMTVEELRRMEAHPLVDIQAHSMTHPILTQVDDTQLKQELAGAKAWLSDCLGKEIRYFCYPNGSLSRRETDGARACYEAAFSTRQASPVVGGDVYVIPRYALTDDYWSNLAKLIGIWRHLVKA